MNVTTAHQLFTRARCLQTSLVHYLLSLLVELLGPSMQRKCRSIIINALTSRESRARAGESLCNPSWCVIEIRFGSQLSRRVESSSADSTPHCNALCDCTIAHLLESGCMHFIAICAPLLFGYARCAVLTCVYDACDQTSVQTTFTYDY